MCGIVGYATTAPGSVDPVLLIEACLAMQHRGPDGEGQWHTDHSGLGHRRLSIIDLESGGQPMSYADGRFWITFNGEIYNYRELRLQLEGMGHRFCTKSDTEVVLAACVQWGRDAPARMRGIFAFGMWDRVERQLLLARDHVGVKPLFYACTPGTIIFASELKGILAADIIPRRIDPTALSDFLALGYVLGSKTIIHNVRRVEPGTTLSWCDGQTTIRSFWNLAAVAQETSLSFSGLEHCSREYVARLDEAVATQLVSDVPVGAFLSGGIDSSSVVYHMARRTAAVPQTFSIGFREPSYSELPYAARVALALETEHRTALVSEDLADSLSTLVRAFDEPLGDTSIVPTYFVSRLARRYVKVVLSGDGADETLAGYDTYAADALQRWYRRVPSPVRTRLVDPVVQWLPDSRRKVSLNYMTKQFVAHASEGRRRAHYGWRLLFSDAHRRALLDGAAEAHDPFTEYDTYFDDVEGASDLNQSLYVDIKTWLANDILVKLDRASMSVGLEARVPFLDPRLVEFSMRLPSSMKMRRLTGKIVLRTAMRGRLPAVVLRRRKRGFNAPVSDWIRGSLRDVARDLLTTPSQLVNVRHPAIQAVWNDHAGGRADHGFRLWALISLLAWEREVLKRPAQPMSTPGPALARSTS